MKVPYPKINPISVSRELAAAVKREAARLGAAATITSTDTENELVYGLRVELDGKIWGNSVAIPWGANADQIAGAKRMIAAWPEMVAGLVWK